MRSALPVAAGFAAALSTACLAAGPAPSALAPAPAPAVVIEAHSDNVYSLALDGPGKRLLSASADNTAKLWDWENRRLLLTLEHEAPVYGAVFSPDGGCLATCSGDARVVLWRASDGARIRSFDGHHAPVYCLAFSDDGRFLASGSGEPENDCILWEVASGRLTAREGAPERPVYGLAFSPSRLAASSSDKSVRLWDAPAFDRRRVLPGHTSDVYRCEFSPDGTLLASASQDKTVRLWHADRGKPVCVLSGHRDPVYAVAFSRDGAVLASAGDDHAILFWDAGSGRLRMTWTAAHRDAIYALAFAPDGTLLSAGAEGKIAVRKPEF